MRVLGGTARGRPLQAPAGHRVRPTPAKVRAAIFNILGARVRGAAALDLYCGSGALGIEALSRGAGTVTFVDQSRTALACVRRNLESVALDRPTRVRRRRLPGQIGPALGAPFDLVFSDPPYGEDPLAELARRLREVVAEDAVWVHEMSGAGLESVGDEVAGGWVLGDRRRYGDTGLLILRR